MNTKFRAKLKTAWEDWLKMKIIIRKILCFWGLHDFEEYWRIFTNTGEYVYLSKRCKHCKKIFRFI